MVDIKLIRIYNYGISAASISLIVLLRRDTGSDLRLSESCTTNEVFLSLMLLIMPAMAKVLHITMLNMQPMADNIPK